MSNLRPISAPQLERNGGRKRCLPGKGLLPWMMLAPQDPTSHRASKTWKNLEKCWRIGRIGRIGRWKHVEKLEGVSFNFTASMQFLHWTLCLAKGTSSAGRSKSAVSRKWPNQSACGYCCHWWRTHREFSKKWKVLYRKLQECEQNKKGASLSFLC